MAAVDAPVRWLLRYAANRWPAGQRADLLREWTGEIRTIAQDSSHRPVIRQWRMLTFGGSLALAPGPGQYAPFGAKRTAAVAIVLSAYLLGLTALQYGWTRVYESHGEGERPILDDAGIPARLVVGLVALIPVVVAALAGWLTGRRSPRSVRPASLGLCLLAVVAGWVGIAFLLDRAEAEFPGPLMVYGFGKQPYGMVTSWAVWLVCFMAAAALLRRVARHRLVGGLIATSAVAAAAVTAATFVQFAPSTAPRSEAWKWFAQWLIPANPYDVSADAGAGSFHSARAVYHFVSSYPHVLLAVAAFGMAFLLSAERRTDTPRDDLGERSVRRPSEGGAG